MLDRSRYLTPAEMAVDPPMSPSGWLLVAAILLGCLIGVGCSGQPLTTIKPNSTNVELLIKDIENRPWE